MNTDLPRAGRLVNGAHLYPVHVYYEDTDAAGIVYHANYLKFAERARSEMLRRLGTEHGRLRETEGAVFVVRRATIDFVAPARLDDELVVVTRIGALRGASLALDQTVQRDEIVLAQLSLSIACIGPQGRPVRLPPELRASLTSLNDKARMVSPHAR